jgi:GntR family transcriptional regulator of vanillate catabolism
MPSSPPIAQELASRIREMILKGEFSAGQHLREVQLAALFGASRTPVRLALASNEKDGLLEYSANRGYVVRTFDAGDISSAYEIRALVEGLAARRASEKGLNAAREKQAATSIAAIDELLSHDEVQLPEFAHERWRIQNAQFHEAIVEQSENQFIKPILLIVQQIPSVYPPIFASYDPKALRNYNEQHRQILAAILAREGTRAEFLMREHIFLAGETICSSMRVSMDRPPLPCEKRA